MKTTCNFFILFTLFTAISASARDHLIYSVAEDIPMGYENEVLKKNYYVNIGTNQGVSNGTVLDVFRTISKSNPYDQLKRINYQVKVGELKVLHSDEEAAIGVIKLINDSENTPLFELRNFIIGDKVSVNVN